MPRIFPTPRTHGARQRGHVAVVGNHNRHVADLLGGAVVDALDLVATLTRNLDEQRSDHGRVAHEGAGGRHADSVDARHLGGGRLEGGHDLVEMVLGILGDLREPHDLLGVHRLSVDDRGDLAVGAARIEADAAALHVPADGLGGLVGGGEGLLGAGDHLELLLIDVLEEAEVEGALALGGVGGRQLLGDLVAAAQVHAEAARAPQGELDEALDVAQVGLGELGPADGALADGDQAVFALDGDGDGVGRLFEVLAHPHAERDELVVENGNVLDRILDAQVVHGLPFFRLRLIADDLG